ncbi:MAG: histidine phosphatase family protein [bacterium]|nr:histidine phosphatase family protein [bacterium]
MEWQIEGEAEKRMDIYIVRHGQTDWNLCGKMQGHTELPLNETGRQQARDMAEMLVGKQITEVYCSNMQRAVETASIIAERLGVSAYMTEGLKEKGYGEIEGLTMDEAKQRYPQDMETWLKNPWENCLPGEGSETGMQVLQRAYSSWCDILERAKGNIVIVTHGGTILTLLGYLFRETPEQIPEKVPNAQPILLRYSPLTQDLARIE